MQDLKSHYEAVWQGWRFVVDGQEIGRIESDLARGYSLHFSSSNLPIGWANTKALSVSEAVVIMEDYWNALTDLVELGEAIYAGNGTFAAKPVLWSCEQTASL